MRSSLICFLLLLLAVPPARGQEPPEQPEPPPLGKLTLTIDPGRHNTTVLRAFFNPEDANQLITLSDDGAIRLWDIEGTKTTKVIYPPGIPYVFLSAMSKDGKRLVVPTRFLNKGKEIHEVCVLSLPEGKLEKVVPLSGKIHALALSPDGRRLATFAFPKEGVLITDLLDGGAPQAVLKGKPIAGCAFSPDGSRLAWVAGKNGSILDLKSGKETGAIQGAPRVAWSPDGKTIATATVLGSNLRLYDESGKLLHEGKHPGFGEDLRFNPDSSMVMVVGRAGTNHHRATIYDVGTGKEKLHFAPHSIGSAGGAFSADGQFVATVGGVDRWTQIFVWRPQNGEIYRKVVGVAWMAGGAANEIPAWSKDSKGVCWRAPAKSKDTFDLAELEFVGTLTKEQRYEPLLENDDVMEKDGLTLKRNDTAIIVLKDGKEIRRFGGSPAASLLGQGVVAVRQGKSWVTATNVLTGLSGKLSPDGRYLMQANSNTQKLRIIPADQKQPLLTLYRKGQDWVIWTEEGYYAATPGGERLMGWKVDNGLDKMPSMYPAERFRKQLYRPDVIKKAFELGSVAAALKALDGDKSQAANVEQLLPPKVTLSIIDQKNLPLLKLKASAQATVKSQPVTMLRLMLDGRPLSDPKTTLRFEPGQATVETEFTVTIPEGKHSLAAFARSPDASNASEAVIVNHVVKANLPSMHVLAIGINDHKDISLKLNCAKNDAQAIAKTFKAASKGNLFREVNTEEILDQQATRDYVLTKINDLRQRVAKSPNDLAVIFFAGHGIKKKDAFYLLTHEADLDKLEGSSLSGDDLRKALGEFPCQVLLMLDACNSAGFGQGKKLAKLGLRPATDDVSRSLTDNDIGVAVFCAAMGHEKAKEEQGNGLFTRAVMDALTKLDEVPFNRVNRLQYLHHVHSHVFDLVSAWSEEKQHPFLNLPWTTESRALRELPKK